AEFDAAGRDLEGAGIDRISVGFPAHLNQDLGDALALPLDDCRDDRHWEGEIRSHGAIRLHGVGGSPAVEEIVTRVARGVHQLSVRLKGITCVRRLVSVTGTLWADRGTSAVPCCSRDEDEPSKPPIVLWRRTPVFG